MNKKIVKIITEFKTIPLRVPFVTALRRVENVEFVRVYISCDDSSIGIGEAPATMAITGEDLEIILASILKLKDNLMGLGIQEALYYIHQSTIGSSAKAALDIALISLLAKEENKTLLEYFKIEDTTPIKTDITISLNEEELMLNDAKLALEESMNILKVKFGSDISHAIKVTKSLAQNLPGAKLLIDANQAWSTKEALLYVTEIEGIGVELIEQPVIADDLKGLRLITNATQVPVLADEAAFTLTDVKKVIESQSADMINIKLMKCGGVSKAIEILEYARESGVKCMLGSMIEGPYSINAALYLTFAYRDVIEYVDLDSPLLYKERPAELDFEFEGATISYSEESAAL
jgi:L-Ala-D/L-Glu epimerase / N-acetyl-D-glutamate racemase